MLLEYRFLLGGVVMKGGDPHLPESKRCDNLACGATFYRRPDEPAYRWRDRTTCSRACGYKVGGSKGGETKRVLASALPGLAPEKLR